VALILDSGPLIAYLDRSDPDRPRCRRLIEESKEVRVIPAPVLVEVDYFVYVRAHPGVMLGFLDDIVNDSFRIQDLEESDYRRVRELCDQYSDSDIGFVDAAVMAIVERLNEPKLATLDHRHFAMIRPRHVDALQLLPE
jgi:predicted nucleic acid-binding protein